MKNITYDDFKSSLPGVVSSILYDGDIVRVAVGDAGAFVLMEEPEYNVLLDALRGVLAVASSAETDEKRITMGMLLQKLGG